MGDPPAPSFTGTHLFATTAAPSQTGGFAPYSWQHRVRLLGPWLLVGMSGWWSLNIIVAELPFFMESLPEGKRMGNLLAVCTQIGNIFPIAYKLLTCRQQTDPSRTVMASQALATLSLVCCAIFWDVLIAGHSAVVLVAAIATGGVGCLSNATYWEAVSTYPASCTRVMSVGMALGALLATALSTLQLAGRPHDNPRFGPRVFFTIAVFFQVVQSIAFLHTVGAGSSSEDEPVELPASVAAANPQEEDMEIAIGDKVHLGEQLMSRAKDSSGPGGLQAESSSESSIFGVQEMEVERSEEVVTSNPRAFIVACFILYSATYTMPTLMPFSVAGFTDETQQQQIFVAMTVCQSIGDVVGRMLTARVKLRRRGLILCFVILASCFSTMFFLAIAQDVMPRVSGYTLSLILLPILTGSYYFFRGFSVTSLYLQARCLGTTHLAGDMGFSGQMGALVANVATFVLTNVLFVF
mmetsp:Transcript_19748/g.52784  ORF Transcript_19748/g.52784 Transcript_19748/m.52784 type:complete len:467 (-) Transcript_19748:174-1574(-)|eukprot:CAMPEP_0194488750 /NCGR_PEP_ID=MMETSP0253-20130528/8558_1 /TAXON_ID=2966 /ORGANISM="Noctiluca scintillans" /LENGTH=466 /DNA_ID=CAMNT_0039329147 /DNA_START=40 /DNA_END=1440 /DNA_ORIENTATION=-